MALMQTLSLERLRAMLSKDVHIIWDIDGTLLDTNGAGVHPFEESLSEITGKVIKLERSKYSGFTDIEILEDLIGSIGLPKLTHSQYLDFKGLYNRRLRLALDNSPAKAIKGATDFLSLTERHKWIHNYIGTGNLFECAIHKLDSASLNQYFTPERLFFCDFIHKSRLSIINRAIQNTPKHQIIIGDSPRDIIVSHELKIPIIAVATGQHTFEELSSLGPFSTLSNNYSADLLFSIIQNFSASNSEMVE
jgi:phosphoglycolate phosphatase-like HAD superfamily hydrolase